MREPQEALEAARRAAATVDDRGEAADWQLEDPARSSRRLVEWAMIEPAQADVYSTRRMGRPITVFKRLLVRLLQQYLGQITAQQSRFNAQVAAHLLALERRVEELERTAREGRSDEFRSR